MDAQPLLEVEDLVVRYRKGRSLAGRADHHTAVDGVSFTLDRKRILGLVGESGSGKSTIGRSILRLVDIHSGRIRYEGTNIDTWGRNTPRRYRKAVQAVFQDPSTSLNPKMTAHDTLSEAIRYHNKVSGPVATKRVKKLLDDVGLAWHYAGRYPHELSGGQQQRVAIARALAPNPKLVVCDEAVSALDVSTQSQVVNLLKDLQDDYDMSYLFISHDLSVVRQISDRFVVLYKGEIVEQGDSETVYQRPQDPYTKRLLSAIPRVPHTKKEQI